MSSSFAADELKTVRALGISFHSVSEIALRRVGDQAELGTPPKLSMQVPSLRFKF